MRKYLLLSSCALSFIAMSAQLQSATYSWVGTTSDLTLNTNWSPNTVPGAGDTGQFSSGTSLTPTIPGVSTTMTPGTFTLLGSNLYTFLINPTGVINFQLPQGLTNASGLTQNVDVTGGSLSFIANTAPTSNATVDYTLSGGSLTYLGNYTDPNYTEITMGNASTLTVSGVGTNASINSLSVSDSASTLALSSNTLTLNSTNTTNTINGQITGGTGTLSVQGNGNLVILNNATNNYGANTIGAGATLQGTPTTIKGSATIASTGTLDFEQPTSSSATFSGQITGAGNVTVNNAGAGNAGTVVLSNATNSYSGTTTITAGTLSVTNLGAIQGSSGIINNGTMDFAASGTYAGTVSGTGNVTVEAGGGTTQLSGLVSYTGTTTVNTGVLELDNVSTLSGNISLATGTSIDFNQVPTSPTIISGAITGNGGVLINSNGGTGTVIFTNTGNTYTGNTAIFDGLLVTSPTTQPGDIAVTSPGYVDFEEPSGSVGIFPGLISGTGSVAINLGGNTGTVILSNPFNNYSGFTDIYNGTLYTENLVGLGTGPIFIDTPAQLIFHQTLNGEINNTLLGTGTVLKEGEASLRYNVDNAGFTGLTDIKNGTLIIDNILGGHVLVREIGLLKGKGTVLGNVHVSELSGISPGNSTADVFHVGGNFKQSGASTYYVHADVNSQAGTVVASKIDVAGTARISPLFDDPQNFAASVKALENADVFPDGFTSVDVNFSGTGQLPLGEVVTTSILHADGGVSGRYGFVTGNYALLTPYLTYGPNDVFLNFVNTLAVLPVTWNEEQVAIQLQSISDPTPLEESILIGITSLPTGEAQEVLDQLSGEQYTTTLLAAELSTRAFMRRLFDPIRLIINDPFDDDSNCCCSRNFTVQTWGDASGHQAFLETGKNFHGMEINGFEFGVGAQVSLFDVFTLGAAYSYEKDFTDYYVGGSAKTMVNQGAVYGLFRPSCYYVLADFIFGCSHNKIKRKINIGDVEYEPYRNVKVWQAGYYVEAGKDFLWRYVLAQPFIALEGGHYSFNGFDESGGFPLGLAVNSKSVTPAYTRFGVHLTTRNRPQWWSFGVDLAWMYRLTSTGTTVYEQFLNFGDEFYIEGPHLQRNSFEAAINFSVLFCRNWEVFGEVTTQSWTNTTTYSFLGGLSATW